VNIFSITYYAIGCLFAILCLISLYQATVRDPGSIEKQYVDLIFIVSYTIYITFILDQRKFSNDKQLF